MEVLEHGLSSKWTRAKSAPGRSRTTVDSPGWLQTALEVELEKSHEELIEMIKSKASLIVESGEEHQPMLFILSNDGKLVICQIAGLTISAKKDWKFVIPEILRKFNATAYAQVFEAWVTDRSDPETLRRLDSGEIGVVDLPPDDRSEQIMISFFENGKTPVVWIGKIQTYREHRFIEKWEAMSDPSSFSGRMMVTEW